MHTNGRRPRLVQAKPLTRRLGLRAYIEERVRERVRSLQTQYGAQVAYPSEALLDDMTLVGAELMADADDPGEKSIRGALWVAYCVQMYAYRFFFDLGRSPGPNPLDNLCEPLRRAVGLAKATVPANASARVRRAAVEGELKKMGRTLENEMRRSVVGAHLARVMAGAYARNEQFVQPVGHSAA